MVYFKLRPPKLVHLKYTSQLQTVSNFIRGGEVLPNENHHSEGAAGKAAYHRQYCSDGMLSHQGEFSWAIPRQDPLHKYSARRPFYFVKVKKTPRQCVGTSMRANIVSRLRSER